MRQTPQYKNKASTQTLRDGLAEYYALNPHLNPPENQPADFGKILLAHDIGHVIYGCDTGIFDELKLLPLFWWTSECTFGAYLKMKDSPAVDVMYADLIQDKGSIWLYREILTVLPKLIPTLIPIWLKTRQWANRMPFLEFEPLLDRTLLEIRQEFNLLQFMP